MRKYLHLALFGALSFSGCGDQVASYSGPVSINLKQKSSDVINSTISTEKGITTESGNPYGAFINLARANLGGVDPSRVELTSATLLLGAGSTGVTSLEQVFSGRVDVLFIMNDTNNSYPAASVTGPTGPGPVNLAVGFDSSVFGGQDRAKLLSGGFKAVLRGPATATFSGKSADVDLQTTFNFRALK